MRIAVYGAGGIGGYFGGRLAQAGADVHFIARGAHLRALREQGLRVRSVKGDFEVRAPATDDPAEVGLCDFVLFCVKTFDTDAAAARLGPLIGAGTAVVSLQNGVENEEKLARAVGEDHVMGGAAYIFARIAEPGVIVHGGGPGSTTFGDLDGRVSQRARRLVAWCEQAGLEAELSASIKTVLWAKLAFICAQVGLTARRGSRSGRSAPQIFPRQPLAAWLPRYAPWPKRMAVPCRRPPRTTPWPWRRPLRRAASPPCMTIWWPGAAWSWKPCTVSSCGRPRSMLWSCPYRRRFTPSSGPGPSATSGPAPEPAAAPGGTSVPAAPPRRSHPEATIG